MGSKLIQNLAQKVEYTTYQNSWNKLCISPAIYVGIDYLSVDAYLSL